MKKPDQRDDFLEKRLVQYDAWLGKGQISFASRVIPVVESITAQKQVLATEQALAILTEASSIALQDCVCRAHYKRCENPLDVCFVLNGIADRLVSRGQARRISIDQAAETLKSANEKGLIHLSLYMPDHELYALCSCCTCCCHDLQIIKKYHRTDIMVRSGYEAVTDLAACTHCAACIERCGFGARHMAGDELTCHAEACIGCGLCVTSCPTGAVTMQIRP